MRDLGHGLCDYGEPFLVAGPRGTFKEGHSNSTKTWAQYSGRGIQKKVWIQGSTYSVAPLLTLVEKKRG